MAYYAAILNMLDPERNQTLRPQHLAYLKKGLEAGTIDSVGAFADGSGGMVIYIAETYEQALEMAKNDPYVVEKVRELDLREWRMTRSL